jgi:peptidoglycan hydrolase CwlO-like protein
MRKNRLILVAALASALALSSCWDKSVDQKVLDVIEDAQEQVDDLSQEEAELVKELKEVKIEKSQAEDELRKAKRLKR